MNIEMPENGRVFVVGMTGSGKTYFSTQLLQNAPRLIVLDHKNEVGRDGLVEQMRLLPESRERWRRFENGKPIRMQIKSPLLASNAAQGYYEPIFKRIYETGDCIVYIDELSSVTTNPQSVPPYLNALYKFGRQPLTDKKGRIVGGNIGMVASSQRPAMIPVDCIGQSETLVMFDLQVPDDKDRMAKYMGRGVLEPIPDEHGFYCYQRYTKDLLYYPGVL